MLNAFVALLRSPDGTEKRSFKSFSPGDFDEHAAKLAKLLSGSPFIWFTSIAAALGGTGLALVSFFLFMIDETTTLGSLGICRIRALQQHLVVELGFAERLVKTTLLPLGEHVTARLVRAGYHDAMYAASHRFDQLLLEVSDKVFTSLAQGKHGHRNPKPIQRRS